MEVIKSWILGIAGAALLSGVMLALAPKGKWASVMTLLCGFMLLSVVVSPVIRLDVQRISKAIVNFKAESGAYGETLDKENRRLMAEIIEREAAEYILDKAAELGIPLERVKIVTRLDDGDYPYPYAAELTGSADAEKRDVLAGLLEGELGIAKERQTWT